MLIILFLFFFSTHRPGQEEGNIPFVEEAGFGKYSGNPSEISRTVCSWMESPDMLRSMQQAALNASRPHATLDIAKDIAEIIFQSKQLQNSRRTNQPQKLRQPL
jgi:UDP-N-acetylglucosamine:LPS N-acetylglucosamine transferase